MSCYLLSFQTRGVLLAILGGGEPPGSPNPDPIPEQKTSFSTPVFKPDPLNPYLFSDLAFRKKFAYFCLVLIHLELKPQIRSYTPVVPSKTIPDSRPKWAKCIPLFRPKRPKNHILWVGTYLYVYIRKFARGFQKAKTCLRVH